MPIQLRVASETDIGLVRENNQDSAYAWAMNPVDGTPVALLIVADGIGGYVAGDIASELATIRVAQGIVPWLEEELKDGPQPLMVLESRLREAMLQANLAVWRHAKEHLGGEEMGCTLTCLLIQGFDFLLGHIGDSRAYLLQDGRLKQLSVDHTPAGELYELGKLDNRELLYHPQRHMLTRALGLSPLLDADITMHHLNLNARILVCSDGLWAYVPEITLERLILRPGAPRSVAKGLIAAANAYGGSDNIGVAICDVRDPSLLKV